MTAVLAIVVLGLLCAGLGVLIAYRERAHDRERGDRERAHDREREALLDRIQTPEIVQAAAAARLIPARPEPEREPDVFVPVTDDDLLLDGQLEPI